MDFSSYVGKVCKLELSTGYYYCGKILVASEKEVCLLDKNGDRVTLSPDIIILIREVHQ